MQRDDGSPSQLGMCDVHRKPEIVYWCYQHDARLCAAEWRKHRDTVPHTHVKQYDEYGEAIREGR